MGENRSTQAVLGKNIEFWMVSPEDDQHREIMEVIEITPFTPTRPLVDVTYHNVSLYRNTTPGLFDNAVVTVRGNFATVDHSGDNRVSFNVLWHWFDEIKKPISCYIIYPKYLDGDDRWRHQFTANITSLSVDTPLDAQMTYTLELTTTGNIHFTNIVIP